MEEQKPSHDKDVEENKLMAAISYFFILCFVPLFMAKESKFAQFHDKQGLVLLGGWVVIMLISAIPFLGWIISPILSLALAVVSILGFVMALQGKRYRMPVVADLADKIKL